MKERAHALFAGVARGGCLLALIASPGCGDDDGTNGGGPVVSDASAPASDAGIDAALDPAIARAMELVEEGQQIFRFDTFGSEAFWGGALRLHEAIAGAELGGVGPGVSPAAALALGLKVDVTMLPQEVRDGIEDGSLDLEDPATTLALLRLNAVIGVTGFFEGDRLASVGIQCALCHSTVDDSFAPGIGGRREGWANRDLNIGAIIAAAPDLSPFEALLGVDEDAVRVALLAWGPGRFDAELLLDGKAFRPDGKTAAVVLPAVFGLAGVNLHTYTGWGGISHWNAFVANLAMQGSGVFYDPRLDDPEKFPIAAANGFANVRREPDLVTSKLPALHLYQLSIPVPTPPAGSFDAEAAARGEVLFGGKADCARCHVPPLFTEPGWNMHTPEEIGIDDFQAERSPDERYRTTPLRGLFTKMEGGFYHDGRFEDLGAVVDHYDDTFELGLTAAEQADLVEYLRSL